MTMDPRMIGKVPPGFECRTVSKYSRKGGKGGPGRPKIEIPPGTGRKVRAGIRDRYGSQVKAAKAWGCSRQYVSMVCREETPPSKIIRLDLGL